MRSLFRRRGAAYAVEYEHPTQGIASAFLRAVADDDADAIWERLSRESRGLLEGRYAARAGLPLHAAAGAGEGDMRVREIIAPLRVAALAALGGPERVNAFGVSAARVVDRGTAYVLLLADFGEERIVAEEDWRPSHLLAFVNESREWLVDLGRTAALSAEAQLPDPLGAIS
jgi:hypothetical protein